MRRRLRTSRRRCSEHAQPAGGLGNRGGPCGYKWARAWGCGRAPPLRYTLFRPSEGCCAPLPEAVAPFSSPGAAVRLREHVGFPEKKFRGHCEAGRQRKVRNDDTGSVGQTSKESDLLSGDGTGGECACNKTLVRKGGNAQDTKQAPHPSADLRQMVYRKDWRGARAPGTPQHPFLSASARVQRGFGALEGTNAMEGHNCVPSGSPFRPVGRERVVRGGESAPVNSSQWLKTVSFSACLGSPRRWSRA
jgi:hypothetical protein